MKTATCEICSNVVSDECHPHNQDVCLECGELVNEVDGCGRCIPCAVANPADEYCPHCGDYFLL